MTNNLIRGRMENSEEEAEAGVTLKECQLRLEAGQIKEGFSSRFTRGSIILLTP